MVPWMMLCGDPYLLCYPCFLSLPTFSAHESKIPDHKSAPRVLIVVVGVRFLLLAIVPSS